MGFALKSLSLEQRAAIARQCFEVKSEDGAWLNGLCPFHEDSNASFGYNCEKDVFKCLAECTEAGDLVDLWSLKNGYPARSREGFNAFVQHYHIEDSAKRHRVPAQTKQAKPAPAPLSEEVGNKENNPIPEQVIQTLGAIPQAMLAELRQRRGWSPAVLEELGVRLLTHYRYKSNIYKLFPIEERDRVAIPVRDFNGVLRNIRTYYPFGVPTTAREGTSKIASWGKGHGSDMLFPSAALLHEGKIILCEGEADCLCARSQGLNAITQTGKSSNWPESFLKHFAGREVAICYDADKAGVKYAQRAAKNLMRVGCTVSILEWPAYMGRLPDGTLPDDHGEDLTDFFVKHGKTLPEFLALLDALRPLNAGAAQDPKNANGTAAGASYLDFFAAGVNGRLSFKPRLLCDYLIRQNELVYHDSSGELYRWDGTYFESFGVENVKQQAVKALDVEADAQRVSNATSLVMSLVTMPHNRDLNDRKDWACLQNGMLNLRTLEFCEHDKDFLSTVKLGVSWHGATPPKPVRWLQFLSETIQTEEPIKQLQEFMGYCLVQDTRFGKVLLLLGPGSDGKSKVLNILRELVGTNNCSAVPLEGLEDQFQRAALFNKMVNIGAEVGSEALQSTYFKSISTGDPINASFKHKDSFEFRPFCKLVYAMNKRPRVLDNTDGFFRRVLPIQFKRQFLENDPAHDPDLEDKLMLELDGIFAWAVIGLHRLLKQKKFSNCQETIDLMLSYRRYNNPVMGFVQDSCDIEDSGGSEDLKVMYKEYKKYCAEGGFKSLNRENFIEELNNAVRELRRHNASAIRVTRPRRNNLRPEVLEGIRLNYVPDGTLYA